MAFMNSSAFTVAVEPIIKQFHKTATEASYLSEWFRVLESQNRLIVEHSVLGSVVPRLGGPLLDASDPYRWKKTWVSFVALVPLLG